MLTVRRLAPRPVTFPCVVCGTDVLAPRVCCSRWCAERLARRRRVRAIDTGCTVLFLGGLAMLAAASWLYWLA